MNPNSSSEKIVNQKNPIAMYVHIPFCAKKCLFCSFAVSIAAEHRMDDYVDAISSELAKFKGQTIGTVYFGGGTPSMLHEDQVTRLCEMIRSTCRLQGALEWTIEANPEHVSLELAQTWKKLGINRVSLGVQTFSDTYLKFLGRNHDAQTALAAHDMLKSVGFENVSVDLMYGFPKQTASELNDDLDQLIDLDCVHVSIYTLTIDPHSRFFAKQLKLDSDDKLADHYEIVRKRLGQEGLLQYEVSNFAKEGYRSKHNSVYWHGGDYIGLGMGAHAYLNGRRSWNAATLMEYLQLIKQKNDATIDAEELPQEKRIIEHLIIGLRDNHGVHVKMLEESLGVAIPEETQGRIRDFIREGLLEFDEQGFLKATDRGRLVLDTISVWLV